MTTLAVAWVTAATTWYAWAQLHARRTHGYPTLGHLVDHRWRTHVPSDPHPPTPTMWNITLIIVALLTWWTNPYPHDTPPR